MADEIYDISEHSHRYGCWCAARAAQRGLGGAKNELLTNAIEWCGVSEVVRTPGNWPQTPGDYDAIHRVWCDKVVRSLRKGGIESATFGRAAKLVAIYVKTTVVLAGYELTPFGRHAHPPIDRILLKSLSRDRRFPVEHRQLWRQATWTEFSKPEYRTIIQSLRESGLSDPFWEIERYWRAA